MTFTIHLIFTFHAGIIFRPLFTTFCSCFVITSLEKIKHIVLHLLFYEFLSKKESFLVSTATLLNCLPHSKGKWFLKCASSSCYLRIPPHASIRKELKRQTYPLPDLRLPITWVAKKLYNFFHFFCPFFYCH